MIITLADIPIVWLTCPKTKDRQPKMEKLLKDLDIKRAVKLVGEITTPYTLGICKDHLSALQLFQDRPKLVLEDDVQANPNVNIDKEYKLELPSDADAVYLGTSTFGRLYGMSHNHTAIVIKENSKYNRIINMLGMHAILYCSERYVNHTISILEQFISNPVGGIDDRICETLYKFNVYSLLNPIFYQDDGHSNQVTLTSVKPIF